jgi:hypothetical protein
VVPGKKSSGPTRLGPSARYSIFALAKDLTAFEIPELAQICETTSTNEKWLAMERSGHTRSVHEGHFRYRYRRASMVSTTRVNLFCMMACFERRNACLTERVSACLFIAAT